jgi:hypothetical protein
MLLCDFRKAQNFLESENQEHKKQLEVERWKAHAAAEKARDMIKVTNQITLCSHYGNASSSNITCIIK